MHWLSANAGHFSYRFHIWLDENNQWWCQCSYNIMILELPYASSGGSNTPGDCGTEQKEKMCILVRLLFNQAKSARGERNMSVHLKELMSLCVIDCISFVVSKCWFINSINYQLLATITILISVFGIGQNFNRSATIHKIFICSYIGCDLLLYYCFFLYFYSIALNHIDMWFKNNLTLWW